MSDGKEKDLQDMLNDNFDEKNIENIEKMFKETPVSSKSYRMVVNHSGPTEVEVSKKSMEIVADILLR